MVLESNQFNQLVEEVKKALLVGSQGVGDVEIGRYREPARPPSCRYGRIGGRGTA